MIYVLTGIAKSGKTKVAREIVKRKSIPLFSTDYIMMMLSKGNKDPDIDIDASDSSVAKDLEPYIYGMISTMIENKVDYLLEGVHFNPDFSRRLIEKYPNDIRIVYLGYKDKNFKDKAKELLEKFDFVYIQNYTSISEVKQCVLITIDEICDAIYSTTSL